MFPDIQDVRPDAPMPKAWGQEIKGVGSLNLSADTKLRPPALFLCLGLIVGRSENVLKCGVLRRLLEQPVSADAPIRDMIGEVPSSEAKPTWHAGVVLEPAFAGQ
jgi:hypothetical protein